MPVMADMIPGPSFSGQRGTGTTTTSDSSSRARYPIYAQWNLVLRAMHISSRESRRLLELGVHGKMESAAVEVHDEPSLSLLLVCILEARRRRDNRHDPPARLLLPFARLATFSLTHEQIQELCVRGELPWLGALGRQLDALLRSVGLGCELLEDEVPNGPRDAPFPPHERRRPARMWDGDTFRPRGRLHSRRGKTGERERRGLTRQLIYYALVYAPRFRA